MILLATGLIALTVAGGSVYQDQRAQHTTDVNYVYDPQYYELDN